MCKILAIMIVPDDDNDSDNNNYSGVKMLSIFDSMAIVQNQQQ